MGLTDTFVRQVKHTGSVAGDKHTDGEGMFLLVKAAGKYWRLAYRFAGKQKTLALGVYPDVSLARARELRAEAKRHLAGGMDPGLVKREQKRNRVTTANNTFDAVADEWIGTAGADLSEKTVKKYRSWLKNHVSPFIGYVPITDLKPLDILNVCKRIEALDVKDTPQRVMQMISQIFRYALAAQKGVAFDVTRDLRGALKPVEQGHHAAITDPVKAGALLRAIDGYEGHHSVVAALKLAPLLFVRPGELRAAEWSEVDLGGAEWRIPAEKMKMGEPHIVPLARQAVEILTWLKERNGHSAFVFAGPRSYKVCLSDGALNAALRAMGYSREVMVAHGFRAMARTIMDEVLGERVDLIEHQLAHMVKDVHGRAYNRTAHLEARRGMMQRWADYLDGLRRGAEVKKLRG